MQGTIHVLPVLITQMARFSLYREFILGLLKKMAELECQSFLWLLFMTHVTCILSLNFSFILAAIVY